MTNEKTITFTREMYNKLKKGAEKGKIDCDYIAQIIQGAVSCDFCIIADEGFADTDFCIAGKYAIDAKYFLLGKDSGYGETDNGTPYDCPGGFYGYLKDTYEETVDGFLTQFDECMENEELIAGTKETVLTWENERKCSIGNTNMNHNS